MKTEITLPYVTTYSTLLKLYDHILTNQRHLKMKQLSTNLGARRNVKMSRRLLRIV